LKWVIIAVSKTSGRFKTREFADVKLFKSLEVVRLVEIPVFNLL
jgi:hypothetical protein